MAARDILSSIRNAVNKVFHSNKKDGSSDAPPVPVPASAKTAAPTLDGGLHSRAHKHGTISAADVAQGDKPNQRDKSHEFHLFRSRIKPPNAVFGVAFTTVQLLVFLVLLVGVAGVGGVVGIAKAYVDTTPVLNVDKIEHQALTSFIYDGNGKLITNYTGMENREWATIDEIPQSLQDAIIAIEDSRFLSHNGIDYKRIVGSFLGNMSDSSGGGGGSTLTQQLIKNTLLTSERTYKRKIQEAWLAMQLENKYDKEQILEAYLNTIPLGQSNYGVKAAAKDYFGKALKDLTLRECAMLAGLTRSPYTYDPRRNTYTRQRMDITNKRTDTVLMRMYELGFIDKAQYEDGLQQTVNIQAENTHNQMYDMPYFVEYAMTDVKNHMLADQGLEKTPENVEKIDSDLRTGGYRIYLTVDPAIQKIAEDTVFNFKGYPKMKIAHDGYTLQSDGSGNVIKTIQPQAAAVVLDYRSGELKAIVGGRQQPTVMRSLNRAYQARMPVGSSIKPIAVYGPAFDKGASPGTIEYNIPAPVKGWGKGGYPGGSTFTGPMTIRQGVKSSVNVMAARTLMDITTIADSVKYLNNMGITDETAVINKDGPGLALGTSGITPIQMSAAFGTFGNLGEYREPLAFRKILDSDGNMILDGNKVRVKRQVFKPSSAWMMVDVLKAAVTGGTGSGANLRTIITAGKTGTNSEARGIAFTGFTAYYSCSVWIGHDSYKSLGSGAWGGTQAAPLFKNIMLAVHNQKKLTNKDIITDTPASLGLVRASVCGVSGLRPTEACSNDIKGYKVVSDWFLRGTVPKEACNMHLKQQICSTSQKMATEFCPEGEVVASSVIVIPGDSIIRKLAPAKILEYFPTALLDFPGVDHLADLSPDNPKYASYFCPYHTAQWAQDKARFDTLVTQSAALNANVRNRIKVLGKQIPAGVVTNCKAKIAVVEGLMKTKFTFTPPPPVNPADVADELQAAYQDLQNYADALLVAPTPPPVVTPTPTVPVATTVIVPVTPTPPPS